MEKKPSSEGTRPNLSRNLSSNLTFRQLRAFVAVAEQASMTQAAARLSLTPSALSMLVRAMEDDLGVKLFERTTRRLLLTDAGKSLLPVVKDVFERLDDGVQSVLRSEQLKESVLTLATSPLMAASFVPKVMAQFRQLHPAVRIRLVDASVDALPDLVRRSAVDLAICTASDEFGDLHQQLLYVDSLMLVCHCDHPLATQSEVRWQQILTEPLVLMQHGSGLRALAEKALAKWDKAVAPAHEVSHVATAIGLVEAGQGVSVLPSYAIARAQPAMSASNVVTIPLVNPVVRRQIVALTKSADVSTDTMNAFIAFYKKECARS